MMKKLLRMEDEIEWVSEYRNHHFHVCAKWKRLNIRYDFSFEVSGLPHFIDIIHDVEYEIKHMASRIVGDLLRAGIGVREASDFFIDSAIGIRHMEESVFLLNRLNMIMNNTDPNLTIKMVEDKVKKGESV